MVIDRTILRWMIYAQLAGALGICFNHLSISLLKVAPALIDSATYSLVGIWAISILFLTSGFLVHWNTHNLLPEHEGWLNRVSGFVIRRFLFLALPCYFIFLVDSMLLSYKDFGPSKNLALLVPSLLSLSHTWFYAIVGNTSVGQPLSAANMAWFGSCVLLLTIIYGLTHAFLRRLGVLIALAAIILLFMLHFWQFTWLFENAKTITSASAERYGSTLAPSYVYWSWLNQYSPYAQITTFFTGVFLAQLVRQGGLDHVIWFGPLLALSVAFFFLGPVVQIWLLGSNVAIVLAICFAAHKFSADDNGQTVSLLDRIGGLAYSILILHMMIYLPFALQISPVATGIGYVYLSLQVIVITAFMILVCYGVSTLLLEPIRQRIQTWFGLEARNDRSF